jgi:hypothetical protein
MIMQGNKNKDKVGVSRNANILDSTIISAKLLCLSCRL